MTDRFGRPLFIDGTFPLGRPSCARALDTARESADTSAFFAAFDANKFWGGPWGSMVDAMPRDVLMLRMVKWLIYSRKHPRSFANTGVR